VSQNCLPTVVSVSCNDNNKCSMFCICSNELSLIYSRTRSTFIPCSYSQFEPCSVCLMFVRIQQSAVVSYSYMYTCSKCLLFVRDHVDQCPVFIQELSYARNFIYISNSCPRFIHRIIQMSPQSLVHTYVHTQSL